MSKPLSDLSLAELLAEVHRGRKEGWLISREALSITFATKCEMELPALLERLAAAEQLPSWIIAKLKTLGDDYQPPDDGRDVVHEIYGWMHVLCFHYVQNIREAVALGFVLRRRWLCGWVSPCGV